MHKTNGVLLHNISIVYLHSFQRLFINYLRQVIRIKTTMVQDYPYTKPRGPVAAMFGSPGPCYGLPGLVGQPRHDPRSVHYRGPAYPFGLKHGKFSDDCSPGPAYLPTSKTYRDGKDGTPHYSLYSRPKDQASFTTPGPGAYKPETTGPATKPSAPKYSMAARTKSRGLDSTPGKSNICIS